MMVYLCDGDSDSECESETPSSEKYGLQVSESFLFSRLKWTARIQFGIEISTHIVNNHSLVICPYHFMSENFLVASNSEGL